MIRRFRRWLEAPVENEHAGIVLDLLENTIRTYRNRLACALRENRYLRRELRRATR